MRMIVKEKLSGGGALKTGMTVKHMFQFLASEVGEKPTGTKLTKVGVKMRCNLCTKTTHIIGTCPLQQARR